MLIDLNGLWRCTFPDESQVEVAVPGCFDSYTKRKDIGDTVVFEREFKLTTVDNVRYFLHFGAVSYYCDVFVNQQKAGSHEGMWDSFMIEVTNQVHNGDNLLRVEVIKPGYYETDRFPVRQVLSGFIPDILHTFGGIWGDVSLLAHTSFVTRHHHGMGLSDGCFKLCIDTNIVESELALTIVSEITDPNDAVVWREQQMFRASAGEKRIEIQGQISNPLLWGEKAPNLYAYKCVISGNDENRILTGRLGFRTISNKGNKLQLNGQPFYLRGVLHWGYYDKEIIPRPSREKIILELESIQQYGFNAIKHCLYIPSKEALSEADRMGIPLWVELPLWQPEKVSELPARVRREYPRILQMLAGHPSVIMISLGCELDNVIEADLLEEMYLLAKKETNTLVRDNSGSGECYDGLNVEFADFFAYHFYGELQDMEQLMETFTPAWRNTKPWLFGEYCDSDTLRDLAVVRQSYGVEKLRWESDDISINPLLAPVMKKEFYCHFHDERVLKNGIADNYARLQELSKAHSLVHRKVTIEHTRAFPEIGGYNVTVLRDTPLCPSGMFDDLGNPKFDLAPFRAANDAVVIVPAWDLTRIWLGADRVKYQERYNFVSESSYGLHILLSNYGPADVRDVTVKWQLCLEDSIIMSDKLSGTDVERGKVGELCCVRFKLPRVNIPQTYALRVTAKHLGGQVYNEWPVFVYPKPTGIDNQIGLYDPGGFFSGVEKLYDVVNLSDGKTIPDELPFVLTSWLSPAILNYVRNGGRVLLMQRGKGVLPVVDGPFWREGMVCRDFPSFWNQLTPTHWADDLRFFSVAADTAFDISGCETFGKVRPYLRRYDCRKWLATDYMCRISIGRGSLLATTLRLDGGMGKQPILLENNCLGRWIVAESIKE